MKLCKLMIWSTNPFSSQVNSVFYSIILFKEIDLTHLRKVQGLYQLQKRSVDGKALGKEYPAEMEAIS